MKRINASGEKEMKIHMRTVRNARNQLKKEALIFAKEIVGKMNFALSQDEKIMKDMKRADRKKR